MIVFSLGDLVIVRRSTRTHDTNPYLDIARNTRVSANLTAIVIEPDAYPHRFTVQVLTRHGTKWVASDGVVPFDPEMKHESW